MMNALSSSIIFCSERDFVLVLSLFLMFFLLLKDGYFPDVLYVYIFWLLSFLLKVIFSVRKIHLLFLVKQNVVSPDVFYVCKHILSQFVCHMFLDA